MIKTLVLLVGVVAMCQAICQEDPCTDFVANVDGENVDARTLNAGGPGGRRGPGAGVFGASPNAAGFLETDREEDTIKREVLGEAAKVAGRTAGSPLRPSYVDTCPEDHHSNKVWWVKDLGGNWVALVHNAGNSQFIHWVTCKNSVCSAPVVRGRCVTRHKYQRALVWKKIRGNWTQRFVWIRLPGCCECEAFMFPDVPFPHFRK